jgi:hypothetical protein
MEHYLMLAILREPFKKAGQLMLNIKKNKLMEKYSAAPREGQITKKIKSQTSKIPSALFLSASQQWVHHSH